MNQLQLNTFRLVEDILMKYSFKYSHNVDGATHTWYFDEKHIRVELHEGEDLIFYQNNNQINSLSNNFDNSFFLLMGLPTRNPITKESLKRILDEIKSR